MEKVCEFCLAFRSVVYCKSDAAHLCLSCDTKVHSANALSHRHPRTLICELCKCRLAYVRCSEHQKFICRGCDRNLHHDSSQQHQKRLISYYMGCPSAKDFVVLWGFDLNELENSVFEDQFVSTSCVSVDPRECCPSVGGFKEGSELTTLTSVFGSESEAGTRSQQNEITNQVVYKGKQRESSCFIWQQILQLKRLQVNEGNNNTSFIRGQEQTGVSSSKSVNNLDQHMQQSLGLHNDLQQMGSPSQEPNLEPFPSSYTQLDHLTSSTTAGNPLQGEDFWQCKSPVRSSQLWSQNMQDLGVCEELSSFDDLNIPDVDMTFRNYEESFGGDQVQSRTLLDDKEITSIPNNKDASMKDTSLVSSVFTTQASYIDKDIGPSNRAHHFPRRERSFHPIHSSYSSSSFNLSRLSGASSATDNKDIGLPPIVTGLDIAQLEDEENAVMRNKEKKKVRRYEKQIRHTSRKTKTESRRKKTMDLTVQM